MREMKKARDRGDGRRVAAVGDEPLESPQVGLGCVGVAPQREHERDVHRAARHDQVLDRRKAWRGRGTLTIRFGRSTAAWMRIASVYVASVS